jgi:hypothetical protein
MFCLQFITVNTKSRNSLVPWAATIHFYFHYISPSCICKIVPPHMIFQTKAYTCIVYILIQLCFAFCPPDLTM